jgi:hypothetical protein
MDIQFFIYGVPDGFDLYGGKLSDIAYFQTYYDGSKEKSKLTIHRRTNNGQVVYSYLRYNLVSAAGRSGAFFGISAMFNGIYCTDVKTLFVLFERVYDTILQEGVLLKNTNNYTAFSVKALKDAQNEINRVVNVLQTNLVNAFAKDFKPLDTSFKATNQNLLRKLDVNKGNEAILAMSRNYPMLSVSPEYKVDEGEIKVISLEQLQHFGKIVANLKPETGASQKEWSDINTLLGVRNSLESRAQQQKTEKDIVFKYRRLTNNITSVFQKYNNEQNNIRQFLQAQKEHPVLLEYYRKLDNSKDILVKLRESMQLIAPVIDQFDPSTGHDHPDTNPSGGGGTKSETPHAWGEKFWHQYSTKLIAGFVVLLGIGVLLYFLYPKKDNSEKSLIAKTDDTVQFQTKNEGNNLSGNENYKADTGTIRKSQNDESEKNTATKPPPMQQPKSKAGEATSKQAGESSTQTDKPVSISILTSDEKRYITDGALRKDDTYPISATNVQGIRMGEWSVTGKDKDAIEITNTKQAQTNMKAIKVGTCTLEYKINETVVASVKLTIM